MVFADHVADDARGLVIRLVRVGTEFVHGEEYAAMNRLEAIANVRKGAADDHAHGVIEVALAHLVFEVDRDDFLRELSHFRFRFPRFPSFFREAKKERSWDGKL
jgi:hypothetical protein